jgi:hypothetical protein
LARFDTRTTRRRRYCLTTYAEVTQAR